MEKGQRGQSSCSGQESAPASSRGGATLTDTPKTTQGTPNSPFQDPSHSSPTTRGRANNGFSFLPSAAKMERQVESGLGLQVRRTLQMPSAQECPAQALEHLGV